MLLFAIMYIEGVINETQSPDHGLARPSPGFRVVYGRSRGNHLCGVVHHKVPATTRVLDHELIRALTWAATMWRP